jgi:hypothetical protein
MKSVARSRCGCRGRPGLVQAGVALVVTLGLAIQAGIVDVEGVLGVGGSVGKRSLSRRAKSAAHGDRRWPLV